MMMSNSHGEAREVSLSRAPKPDGTERLSGLRRAWHDYGLSIVLVVLFLFAMAGQTLTGWHVYNANSAIMESARSR